MSKGKTKQNQIETYSTEMPQVNRMMGRDSASSETQPTVRPSQWRDPANRETAQAEQSDPREGEQGAGIWLTPQTAGDQCL